MIPVATPRRVGRRANVNLALGCDVSPRRSQLTSITLATAMGDAASIEASRK